MAKMVNPEVEVVRFENEDVVALSRGRSFSISGNGFSVYNGAYGLGWHSPNGSTGSNSLSALIGQMNSAYDIPSNTSADNIILHEQNNETRTLQTAWNDWNSSSDRLYGYTESRTDSDSGVTTYHFLSQ